MTRNFDLVVIATGEAASAVSSRCRSAGWQVAVIDSLRSGMRATDLKHMVYVYPTRGSDEPYMS